MGHRRWWWISDLGRHRGNALEPNRSANRPRCKGSIIWHFTERNFGDGSHHHRLALERLTHAHRSGIGRSRRNISITGGYQVARLFSLAHVSIQQPSNPFQFKRNSVSKFYTHHRHYQRTVSGSQRESIGGQRNIARCFKRRDYTDNLNASCYGDNKWLSRIDRLDYV